MRKKFLAITLVVAMVMSLMGCSSSSNSNTPSSGTSEATKPAELTKVSFRLNYTAAGLHTPFYYALEKGYYEEVGLDVSIGEGTGSGTTAKLVGSGDDDLGLVDSASIASAVANDIPVKIVCPVYAVNGFAIITLDGSGIESPKDLEGKKVGITTGDAPANLFAAVEAANGIDDSKINYVTMDSNAKVTSLINGDVDCILGGADDQAITLENMGHKVKVLRYSDNGAATVGLSVVASDSMIKDNPEVIKKFVQATMKAWDECRKDSTAAVDNFMSKFPTLDQKVVEGSLGVALDSLLAADSKTLGDVTETDWQSCRDLLVNYLGIDSSIQPTDIYTYDCLPTELPAK